LGSGDFAPNRSIVLTIEEYPFDENGMFLRTGEMNKQRYDYMLALAEEMQVVLTEELGHRVVVMVGL